MPRSMCRTVSEDKLNPSYDIHKRTVYKWYTHAMEVKSRASPCSNHAAVSGSCSRLQMEMVGNTGRRLLVTPASYVRPFIFPKYKKVNSSLPQLLRYKQELNRCEWSCIDYRDVPSSNRKREGRIKTASRQDGFRTGRRSWGRTGVAGQWRGRFWHLW